LKPLGFLLYAVVCAIGFWIAYPEEKVERRVILEAAKDYLNYLYAFRTKEAFLVASFNVMGNASRLLSKEELEELCDYFQALYEKMKEEK
jgi:ABC-type sulfate transport system substrate-binding protein